MNIKSIILALLTTLFLLFIFWYGGIDFLERGVYSAFFLFLSVWFGLGVYFLVNELSSLNMKYKK